MLYLLHYHITEFVFIIISYSTPSLAVVHSYHGETILILDIAIKQGTLNIG